MIMLAAVTTAVAGDFLPAEIKRSTPEPGDNTVIHRCLTPQLQDGEGLPLERERPWSLPRAALAPDYDTTIHCLVLRFNFQYEDPDVPTTTGRGHFDLSPHPLPNNSNNATPQDSIDYLNRVGHFIDPPPHDSVYFDRHLRALHTYWDFVSKGKIGLT